jgi:hypothetical protein
VALLTADVDHLDRNSELLSLDAMDLGHDLTETPTGYWRGASLEG